VSRRDLALGGLLALAGLGAAAVAAELILRIRPLPAVEARRRGPVRGEAARFYRHDSELGWAGRPGAGGPLGGWEFESEVVLNARGFRDAEVPATKPPATHRVVVLGDSITWGLGVDRGERYPDLLAARLASHGLAVEVVNLGVNGYGTDQEYLLFRREGRRYCADLVVLGAYENDARENAAAVQGRYPKPYFRRAPGGGLVLENVPVPRIEGWDARAPAPPAGLRAWLRRHLRLYAAGAFLREEARRRLVPTAPPARPADPPEAVELTAALIRGLADEVARAGARFAVVVLPDLYYSAVTMSAATRAGVEPVLDLTPAFRERTRAGERLFYALDGAHWTPRAHAMAADGIAAFVARAGLLSRPPRACA
jgi:lysophospholipase L1-like esterase